LPQNAQAPDCLHTVGGAQLFMAPSWTPDQKGVKVQIVDVFALRLATGYEKDPAGRLRLQSEESVAQGRTWSLAKACQLVRNDAAPHRWVVLHRQKKAWGLFWAGGGLDLCRDELTTRAGSELETAIVPATPEALLRLVLSMEEPDPEADQARKGKNEKRGKSIAAYTGFPWRGLAITTSTAVAVLAVVNLFLMTKIVSQEQKLDQLIELAKPRR